MLSNSCSLPIQCQSEFPLEMCVAFSYHNSLLGGAGGVQTVSGMTMSLLDRIYSSILLIKSNFSARMYGGHARLHFPPKGYHIQVVSCMSIL